MSILFRSISILDSSKPFFALNPITLTLYLESFLIKKLFSTKNPNKINIEHSANFFLSDDLGGTDTKHYTDVIMTNEPEVSFTFTVLKNLLYAIKVALTFEDADKNSGIRQLYEISQLGEGYNKNIITPKWMKIDAKDMKKVDKKDFREELKIKDNKLLVFVKFHHIVPFQKQYLETHLVKS